ncbi:MAG: FGGY-family carbohydrate kinase [Rubrobacteraceae bacterium]
MRAEGSGAPLTIGVDLGTQSVRVVLLEEDGTEAGSGSAPLSSVRSDDVRHEQDPESWWEAVGRAAREAMGEVGNREVSGLAICSTSGTILLADDEGRPLTTAIMYNDGRAPEEAKRAQEAGAEVWDALGYRISGSYALPRLMWFLENGYAKNASRMMHQADFVASRLAGEPVATDWSHALKTGYDLVNDRWPEQVMERLEVPVSLLPPAVRPGTRIGEVGESAAEYTGILAGTPIHAGMTDSCAAQISAGALTEGQWNSVLGTTLVLKGVTRELLKDPSGAVYCHRHPDGGWLPGGASSTGAGIISDMFPGADLDALNEKAERRGPSSVVVYPLASKGERFPFAEPDAEGFRVGEPEDDVDLFRAVLEGVAFVERLCFAHLEGLGASVSGPVSATGGGAKSRLWSQIRADVLGVPVTVPVSTEGSVGMAILARAGEGSVAEAAARMSRTKWEFEPNESNGKLAENFETLASAFVERGYISEDLARRARLM